MNTLISDNCIRDFILDAFDLAIKFYKNCAINANDARQITRADIKSKEYASGIAIIDLLVDPDGETFLVPDSADIVINSLINFLKDIDKTKNPLLSYYIGNVVIQCRNEECFSVGIDDGNSNRSIN